MRHYEITNETMVWNGRTLRRGQLGGWIESERNLEQGSGAWIADEAKVVKDRAELSGHAHVIHFAIVGDHAKIGERAGRAVVSGEAGDDHGQRAGDRQRNL